MSVIAQGNGFHLAICVTIDDPRIRRLAVYGLEEACVRLGLPLRVVEGEATDGMIIYGPVPPGWRGGVLTYDPRCYNPETRFKAIASPPLWAPEGENAENIDLIGGIARLLTLADETQVREGSRNAHGIFRVEDLPAARASVSMEPLVEHHIAALGQRLMPLASNLPTARPLWPGGHRHAVVVTHDTDAVALRAPLEIVFNAVKAVVRRDPVSARMAWDGLTLRGEDPLFGFGTWAETERAAGLRSCFLIYGRGIVRRTLSDCRSSILNRATEWTLLRHLADEGWEFGFHPSMRAKDDVEEFVWGKQMLEAALNRQVHGLRHHYWALDWLRPHLTFQKHVKVGFEYDMSIAWADAIGLRAGTCLPYRPFDPDHGYSLDIYELPTAVMDGYLVPENGNVAPTASNVQRFLDDVRRMGGMLVLDWHTEAAGDAYCYRGRGGAFARVIAELQTSTDAWFVTPWELVKYWDQRRRSLWLNMTSC
jgi:hypothetical protein